MVTKTKVPGGKGVKKSKAKAKAKAKPAKKKGEGQVSGERVASAKLDAKKVKAIRTALKKGASLSELSNKYGVSRRTITCVRDGITWSHVK